MQSIKVHNVSGDVRPINAISVWDASSTGKRPVDSIPVWDDTNAGEKPLNAIQVKLVNDEPSAIKVWFKGDEPGPGPVDPYNPLGLPPYTIRVEGYVNASMLPEAATCTETAPGSNVYDVTYVSADWSRLFEQQASITGVFGANTTNVTNMSNMFHRCFDLHYVHLFDTSNVTDMQSMFEECHDLVGLYGTFNTSNVTDMSNMFEGCHYLNSMPVFVNTSNVVTMRSMFYGCDALTNASLYDTSNVTDMGYMFHYCSALIYVPLFNTSNVMNMEGMFEGCVNVQFGALALYQQASSQTNPPSYHSNTFRQCGTMTTTGVAELAQIPENWGGTKSD